jgi:putative holliday junction resolvase
MFESDDKTILSIDYGTRRIGLAKSDPTGFLASPLITLEVKSVKDALVQIAKVVANTQPTAIVIGYPLFRSGDKSLKCDEVDAFIEKLKGIFPGPIIRVDEGYSSVEAGHIIHAHGKKVGRQKKRVDRLAAVIILQRYLDETSSR